MRKYREIMRVYIKAQLAWRADVVFNMLFTVAKILFAWLLWGLIFKGRDMVAGFKFLFVPAGNVQGHQRGNQRQDPERDFFQLYGDACEHRGVLCRHGGGGGAVLSVL